MLIVTRVTDVKNHVGEVREFLIGEATHCRGGKTRGSDGATITSTIRCADGTAPSRSRRRGSSSELVRGPGWASAHE